MGNLRSVSKALEAQGARVLVSSRPGAFRRADGVVLPGVGAFREAMKRLRGLGLEKPVREWVEARRPFLGICLGYQLLFGESSEFGRSRGLGIFRGKVVRFPRGLAVPHMGWNSIVPRSGSWLFRGLPRKPWVYFVHSYFPVPRDGRIVASRTGYGKPFASAIEDGQVAAMQFHPEKSQKTGLRILRNFVEMVAKFPSSPSPLPPRRGERIRERRAALSRRRRS